MLQIAARKWMTSQPFLGILLWVLLSGEICHKKGASNCKLIAAMCQAKEESSRAAPSRLWKRIKLQWDIGLSKNRVACHPVVYHHFILPIKVAIYYPISRTVCSILPAAHDLELSVHFLSSTRCPKDYFLFRPSMASRWLSGDAMTSTRTHIQTNSGSASSRWSYQTITNTESKFQALQDSADFPGSQVDS